jgi:hypothetical protein
MTIFGDAVFVACMFATLTSAKKEKQRSQEGTCIVILMYKY